MIGIAVIGDIRGSRDLPDRARTQTQLRSACDELNARTDDLQLLSPFTVTLGDEFQALFQASGGLWRGIFRIESLLKPVRLRFGVGVGAIDTEINREAAIGMDGPAFHRARESVTGLKRDGGSYRVQGLGQAERLARHALDLVSHERDSWRENRVDIFSSMLAGVSVAEMAQSLGISEQAVYKNIREGQLETIRGICDSIGDLMDGALRKAPETS
jgi:hypothetical protein